MGQEHASDMVVVTRTAARPRTRPPDGTDGVPDTLTVAIRLASRWRRTGRRTGRGDGRPGSAGTGAGTAPAGDRRSPSAPIVEGRETAAALASSSRVHTARRRRSNPSPRSSRWTGRLPLVGTVRRATTARLDEMARRRRASSTSTRWSSTDFVRHRHRPGHGLARRPAPRRPDVRATCSPRCSPRSCSVASRPGRTDPRGARRGHRRGAPDRIGSLTEEPGAARRRRRRHRPRHPRGARPAARQPRSDHGEDRPPSSSR